MQPGDLLAKRFRITELIGRGGMGSVYRGMDEHSGAEVAIKVTQWLDPETCRRFLLEAEALASLRHKNIVSYVAHGALSNRVPYLVMEWLNGEDLGKRLSQKPLTVADTIAVGVQVAAALGAAHARGIIHRDLKPTNLFLMDGDIHRLKLLDFGLARLCDYEGRMSRLTSEGQLLGTPGYIAPEQARGELTLDHRVDLYSLGAVLYTCLTTKPPYVANHVVGLLAKLLFEPIPRIRPHRSDVPLGLEVLIANLMSRSPEERVQSADEVILSLRRIGSGMAGLDDGDSAPRRASRFWSILVIGSGARSLDSEKLATIARDHRAELAHLANRSAAALVCQGDDLVGTVARAAQCSAALRSTFGEVPMALATGRDDTRDGMPLSAVIDRAVAMWLDRDSGAEGPLASAAPLTQLAVDELTAHTLSGMPSMQLPTVRIRQDSEKGTLEPREVRFDGCAGREEELAKLLTLIKQCGGRGPGERSGQSEPGGQSKPGGQPAAAFVVGAVGIGKSQLCRALAAALARQSGIRLCGIGCGVWSRRRSPFRLIGAITRQLLGVTSAQDEPSAVQRLIERLGALELEHPRALAASIASLAELGGSGAAGGSLPAALEHELGSELAHVHVRNYPAMLREDMQRAWIRWLDAEAALGTVVLLLDDVHCADQPSLALIGRALRALDNRARPLAVVAFARPEIRERFPSLWTTYVRETIVLGPLSEEALMEACLWVYDGASVSLMRPLVRAAFGNPLQLEELMRAGINFARRDMVELTAMALREVAEDELRLLQAASVLGRYFDLDALFVLAEVRAEQALPAIDRLLGRGMFVSGERIAGCGFAHGFASEAWQRAAYQSLTPARRKDLHKRAAKWLGATSRPEAAVVATHWLSAEAAVHAGPWLVQAARLCAVAEDYESALEAAKKALPTAGSGPMRGQLCLVHAEASLGLGDHEAAYLWARAALEHLPEGRAEWAQAAQYAVTAACATGRYREAEDVADALLDGAPQKPDERYLVAAAMMATELVTHRQLGAPRRLCAMLDQRATATPVLAAAMAELRGLLASADGHEDEAVDSLKRAAVYWRELGAERRSWMAEEWAAAKMCALGEYERAAELLESGFAEAVRAGYDERVRLSARDLAMAVARSGNIEKAVALFSASPVLGDEREPRLRALGHVYRAQVHFLCRDLASAYAELGSALSLLPGGDAGGERAFALAVRAQVLLADDRIADALACAREAIQIVDVLGSIEHGDALVRLVHAATLHASGDVDAAYAAIRAAQSHLLRRARHIKDPLRRANFLDRVPENALTLALSAVWGNLASLPAAAPGAIPGGAAGAISGGAPGAMPGAVDKPAGHN